MADYIAVKGQRGINVSLPDAYKFAMAGHPELQKIIADRTGNADSVDALGKARQASVSVAQATNPGDNTVPANETRKETIARMMDGG
jgi:hypothetical protein